MLEKKVSIIALMVIAIGGLGILLGAFYGQSWAKDQDYMLVGRCFNKLVVLDCERDEILKEITTQVKRIREIVVAPDKKNVYVLGDSPGNIDKVNLETGKVERVCTLSAGNMAVYMIGADVSPDGSEFYVNCLPRETALDQFNVLPTYIAVLDTSTWKVKRKIEDLDMSVVGIALGPDGKKIYCIGRDIYIKDSKTGKLIDTIPVVNNPKKAAIILPIGPWNVWQQSGWFSSPYYAEDPASSTGWSYGLLNLELATGKTEWAHIDEFHYRPHDEFLFTSVLSPDLKYIYGMMNRLTKYDNVAKKKITDIPLIHTTYVINISSDGKKIYCSGAGPSISVFTAEPFAAKTVVHLRRDTVFSAITAVNRPPLPH